VDSDPLLPACFETVLELKGFRERKYVCALLSQCSVNGCAFSDEAVDLLYEAYSGHPRSTLLVADRAMRVTEGKLITASSVNYARGEVDRMIQVEQLGSRRFNSSHSDERDR
jgi:hypothetical protein